ncbi:condensation domain-containing protein [Micromonospora sp. WMMD1082]|uniref:condensation domain-containing protein n=1 Tax=Micromonospora sp. WMMD1082 TaxID=3016104 RepID=UPI0024170A25|nr:condensation domain-containing protein [Micromonospora sp. WMMD1082]MDG4797042.1 condensation domain-containing protein [Micromonospora sp. WMMD1082]
MTDIETAAGRLAPLSFPQEQLWLMESLAPGTYNEVWVLRIEGDLRLPLLQRSLDVVLGRHEVLRSTFDTVDGAPVCRILPELTIDLGQPTDLSYVPVTLRDRMVADLAAMVADPPYDLRTGPLVRASLLHLDDTEHVLVLATHHIVADGWSLRVVLHELLAAYEAFAAGRVPDLPALPRQYRHFAEEQRRLLDERELADERRYWRDQLDGAVPVLHLRPATLRPPVKSPRGRRIQVTFPAGLARSLYRYATGGRSTPAAVLLAAFTAVVHRYTGRQDLLIGTASAARPDEQWEPLVGFFAATVPLRLRPAPEQSFHELVRHVMEVSLDALDHDRLPFSHLVDLVRPDRDPSYHPLVQVVFSHVDVRDAELSGHTLRIRYEHVPRSRSRFDLIVEAQTGPGSLGFWLEFDEALLPEPFVRGLFTHLRTLLAAAIEAPRMAITDLPMLSAAERAVAIAEVPPAGTPVPASEQVVQGIDTLAPRGVTGRIVAIDPQHVRLVVDRLMPVHGQILADTGDLGFVDERGDIVRLGRRDRHPMVNGLTVPLDDVAATLSVHPGVRAAQVAYDGAPPVLRARVTRAGDAAPTSAQLAEFLATRLPRYAIPTVIEMDRPVDGSTDGGRLAGQVREIWRQVMAQDEIGDDDDFFALGGHSIMAAELASRLRTELGRPVSIRWIFEAPTVRSLVRRIEREAVPGALRAGTAARPGVVPPGSAAVPAGAAGAPLTAAQTQIWVLDRLAPGRATYHSPLRVDITGPLDPAALRQAFARVVEGHEMLRSVIRFVVDRPVQVPQPHGPQLAVTDLSALPPQARAAEIDRLAVAQALRPFDLAREPGIRATLIVAPDRRHVLLLTVHHIAMDGVGYQAFCRDLSACYNALVAGDVAPSPSPRLTWQQYARWEDEWLSGPEPTRLWAYWERTLAGLPVLPLPTPLPRPPLPTFDGDQLAVLLDPEQTGTVLRLAATQRVSPFVLATAALAALLHQLAGSDDIPIGAVGENRRLPGAPGLVGCTIATLVLRVDCAGDPSFAELLARVRDTVLDAYDHQGLPFPQLVRAAAMPRQLDRLPLFQVAVEWQEPDRSGWDLAGCAVDWQFTRLDTARNDLYFTAAVRADRLELSVEFNTNLWDAASARGLLARWRDLLLAAARRPGQRLSELAG